MVDICSLVHTCGAVVDVTFVLKLKKNSIVFTLGIKSLNDSLLDTLYS